MREKTHILLVEDEAIIALDTKSCLERCGYVVDGVADNAKDTLDFLKKYSPDLVLMDIKLKGKQTGLDISSTIQTLYSTPVVYLTSMDDDETLKKAQKTKPYGYVLKPVSEKQLNSTILMALSHFQENNNLLKINKNYRYSFEQKSLYYLGVEVNLTKREREFLFILTKNLYGIVPIKQLKIQIWGEEVTDTTLRSLVRRVRDKLHEDLIENIISVGYKLKIENEG